jgi:hypothetical protein
MSLINALHRLITVSIAAGFYHLRIYRPYATDVLYYPYVENHRDKTKPVTMTQIEWLNHRSNYHFSFTCERVLPQNDGSFYCLNCTAKPTSYCEGVLRALPKLNNWVIPMIYLDRNEHDTDVKYFLTPTQAYELWNGDWTRIFDPAFFFYI